MNKKKPAKSKTGEIELVYLPKKLPKKLNLQCIRCDKKLECDGHGGGNATHYPNVYGGVVFRSSGQFGSRVLDCGVGIPGGFQSEIQIILCDECVTENGDRVNTMTDKRHVRVEYTDKLNKGRTRIEEWSDYRTWNDMEDVRLKNLKASVRELEKKKDRNTYESEHLQQMKDALEQHEKEHKARKARD